jgi:hypothetical protein
MFGRFWIFSLLFAGLLFPCALGAAVSVNGGILKVEEYINRPQSEIQSMAQENEKKGQELFDLGQFRESIPWFERSSFFSKVLIEQAKRADQGQQAQAQLREQERLEQDRLRALALQRLNAAQRELQSAGQRIQ